MANFAFDPSMFTTNRKAPIDAAKALGPRLREGGIDATLLSKFLSPTGDLLDPSAIPLSDFARPDVSGVTSAIKSVPKVVGPPAGGASMLISDAPQEAAVSAVAPAVDLGAASSDLFGNISDLSQIDVPEVGDIRRRPLKNLVDIAGALAPGVEETPLTTEQLTGGDLFGLSAPEVQNVVATRANLRQVKSETDKKALDFLRTASGQKNAEQLVKEKIREESADERTRFATESAAAEGVKAFNRQALIENRKSKLTIAKTLLTAKANIAAKAAENTPFSDAWKEKLASIRLKIAEINPVLASGLADTLDPNEALSRLEADKTLPADSALKMDAATKKLFKDLINMSILPTGTGASVDSAFPNEEVE